MLAARKSILLVIVIVFISLGCKAQNITIDSLKLVLATSNNDTVRCGLYYDIGYQYYMVDLKSTILYADSLLELSKRTGYKKGLVKYHNLMGIYHDQKGNFNKSIEEYNKSLDISRSINYRKGISSSYNNIGVIYEVLGRYPEALESYQKSLYIDTEINDSSGMANSYLQLGNISESQGDDKNAFEYYSNALEIANIINDEILIIYGSLNVGYLLESQNTTDTAYKYFDTAYLLSKKLGEKEGLLLSSMMLGILNTNNGSYDKAEKYLKLSLKLSNEIGSNVHAQHSNFRLADLYLAKGNLKQAYKFAKLAFDNEDGECDENLRISCSLMLSEICAKLGKYREAYNYHVVYHKMQDSIYNKTSIAKIADLEYKYKYEKDKQKLELQQQRIDYENNAKRRRQLTIQHTLLSLFFGLIILLILIVRISYRRKRNNKRLAEKNNTIQKYANELNEVNITKDKFFSIIAHDLKGPIGTLSNLLKLLIDRYELISDEEKFRILVSATKTSSNSYNLLMNLLHWSRSKRGKIDFNPEKFYLSESMNRIFALLKETIIQKKQRIEISISDDISIVNDKLMFETILRNLITNAIKFTSEGGEIDVKAEKNNGSLELSVSDSGIGIPESVIDDLFKIDTDFKRNGTNNENGTGLGLLLCGEFADKMGGSISVTSEEGKGSRFVLKIPEKPTA